ncbi:MAG: hypothetical protein JOY93_12265, partial [Acidobacteriales bacterium]|nr:hypothetical protein [Terriglobales bacterium]
MIRGRLVIAIGGLLLASLCAQAQFPNLSGSSNCTAADFVANFDFATGPGDTYTLVINKRNVSSHACVFDGPVYGPSLAPDRVEGEPPVPLCYDCKNRGLPPAQRWLDPPITVKSGQVARQTIRWRTKPQNAKCLQLDWISVGSGLLVVPSLFKPVCSEVDFSPFTLAPSEETLPDVVQVPALKLASAKTQYYERESFFLKVTRLDAVGANIEPCPRLYLWHRSP